MKEATDREVDSCGTHHSKDIQTRAQLRLSIWAIHLKSPTAALAQAQEFLEVQISGES